MSEAVVTQPVKLFNGLQPVCVCVCVCVCVRMCLNICGCTVYGGSTKTIITKEKGNRGVSKWSLALIKHLCYYSTLWLCTVLPESQHTPPHVTMLRSTVVTAEHLFTAANISLNISCDTDTCNIVFQLH